MKRSLLFAISTFVLVTLVNPYTSFAQNTPPIADAGPDQDIVVGEFTILEGSAFDPNGNPIMHWLWTIEITPEGSSSYVSNPTIPGPLFMGDVEGDYVLSLMVSDGVDWSEPDSVTIHVTLIRPPVAIATADPTNGPAPLTVQFDASQSYHPNADRGFEITNFHWNFGDGLGGSTEMSPIYTYPLLSGTYSASLTVFDNHGQSANAVVQITVLDPVAAQLSTWGHIKALYR